jgi:hypothetical protein
MATDVHVESIPALDIRLDTPEWFEWLSSQSQFKYIGNSTEMSVKRRASNDKWYARKKVWSSDKGSTPVDLYLGSNEEVTSEKLREINYYFGLESNKFWQWYHSPARKQSKGKGVQDTEMYTEQPQPSQIRDDIEELRARIAELEQSDSELQSTNQALEKHLPPGGVGRITTSSGLLLYWHALSNHHCWSTAPPPSTAFTDSEQ